MRKRFLSVIGFAIVCRFSAYAQAKVDTTTLPKKAPISLYTPVGQDTSSSYKARQLHVDEVNFVSSFYNQNGNHSAVTGGIGTEQVTDIANSLTVNLVWLNKKSNKNTLAVGVGFDYHSAASQAFVSQTGASSPTGTRIYPSLDWTVENAKNGSSFGLGVYFSGEYNYTSLGSDIHWSKKTNDKSGEFGIKLQGYFDKVKQIYPSELIPTTTTTTSTGTIVTTASGNSFTSGSDGGGGRGNIPSERRTTLSASLSYSQIINSRLQIMFLGDVVKQSGFLSLPFHRVYFSNGKDTIERLPSSRFKLPVGFRLNYFVGDNVIIRSYYRYYWDDWGSKSNTVGLEVPVKVTPFFSVSPFYRYYDQTAAKYFAPYEQHSANEQYFTSNYEYAKFRSGFYGVGIRMAPPKGVFGIQGLHEMEIRYGHYTQTTDLVSDVVSVSLGFK